jgi:carboxymethylenebutenolidase
MARSPWRHARFGGGRAMVFCPPIGGESSMIERMAEIPTKAGRMETFIAHPRDDGPHPAVVVYMDIWGMREELFDIARNVASVGYYVMVPDLYYRQGKIRERNFFDAEGRTVSFEALDDTLKQYALAPAMKTKDEMVLEDTAALIDFVAGDEAAKPGAMGCFGYCLGGRLVLRVAGTFPDRIRAAASLHGSDIVTDKPDSPHRIAAKANGEIYSGFGERDWFSPSPVIATMVETLSSVSGLAYRHTIHPDTPHGYALPDRDVYNKRATFTDWENIFAMFRRQLG